jgi:DNA-binding transcriptional LysR family regulator
MLTLCTYVHSDSLMTSIDALDGVTLFLAVAEARSFTVAAGRLGVTPTAVSKAVRVMEARHGVVLFQRTTRRVALTEAGAALWLRLRPAAAEIGDALAALGTFRDRPSGTLRLTVPAMARRFITPLVAEYARAYPDVTVEVSLDDAIIDLVDAGFDAGVRLGESIEKDMVAVALTPQIRWSIVGAPAYFARAGRPRKPEDLVAHTAVRYRFPGSRAVHRWGFRRGKRSFVVDVGGKLIVDDRQLLVALAAEGLGLAFASHVEVRDRVDAGVLESVLGAFIPSDAGMYLCFPARSQSQLKLRAFIDLAREVIARPDYLALCHGEMGQESMP